MLFQLKTISFLGKACSIICQNENGPCPLLAIANILILQRRIVLDPYATTISLSELVTVVANVMISEVDSRESRGISKEFERSTLSTVLQILPKLANGLDLNVFFSSVDKFEFTPEISVFDILGLKLYHGWLVDPKGDALTVRAMGNLSYTQCVLKLVEFKTLSDKIRNSTELNRPVDLKEDEKELIRSGLTIEKFLNQNATQLTTAGLHTLYNVMTDRQLSVFFRNNHFSTLFSYNGQLFNLVTDAGYQHEHTVVWEILDGIDGSSEFYNASFDPLSSYKVSDYSPPPLSSAGSSFKSSYGGTIAAPPPSAQQPQVRQGNTFAVPPPSSSGGTYATANSSNNNGFFSSHINTTSSSSGGNTRTLDTFANPLHQPGGGGAAPSSAVRGTVVSSPLKGNVVAPASVITGTAAPPAAALRSTAAPNPVSGRPTHAPTDDDDMRGMSGVPAPAASSPGNPMTRSAYAQASPVLSAQRQLIRTASMDAKQFKQSPTAGSAGSASTGSALNLSVPSADPLVQQSQSLDSLQYSPMSFSEPSPGNPHLQQQQGANRIVAPPLQRTAATAPSPASQYSSASPSAVPRLDLPSSVSSGAESVPVVSLAATAKEHSSIVASQRQLLRTASKRSMDPEAPIAASQMSPRPENSGSAPTRGMLRSGSDVTGSSSLPPTHSNGSLLRSASSGSNSAHSPNERTQSLPLSRLEQQQMLALNSLRRGGSGSGSGTPPVQQRDSEEVGSVTSGGSGPHQQQQQPRGAWSHELSPNKSNEVYISRYGANSGGSGGGSGTGSAASSYSDTSPMAYNNAFSPQSSPTKRSGSRDASGPGGNGGSAGSGGGREHSNAIKTAINTIINSNSSALPSIINTIIDSSQGSNPGSVSSGSSKPPGTNNSRSFNSGGIATKSYDDEDLRMNDAQYRAMQAAADPKPLAPDEDEDYLLALRLQQEMNTLSNSSSTSATIAAPPPVPGPSGGSAATTGTSPLPPNGLSSSSSDGQGKFDVLRYGSSSQARGGAAAGGSGSSSSPVPPLARQNSAGVTAAAAGVPIPSGGGSANALTRQGSAGAIQKSNSSSGYNLLGRQSSKPTNTLPVATNLTPAAPAPASPKAAGAVSAPVPPAAPTAASSSEFEQYLSPAELAEQRAAMEAFERGRRTSGENNAGSAQGAKKKGFLGGLFG